MKRLFGLSAEGAALGQTSAATSGLAENVGAVTAENDGLGVAAEGNTQRKNVSAIQTRFKYSRNEEKVVSEK